MNYSVIQNFSNNEHGDDYVCGDIHGCFDLLDEELIQLGFDKSKDRLFTVGDLFDRGPLSAKFIDYLSQPWFFSILGNHELFLLQSQWPLEDTSESNWRKVNTRKNIFDVWQINGGEWWTTIDSHTQTKMFNMVNELPLLIELDIDDNKVGFAHAEIRHSWTLTKQYANELPIDKLNWDNEFISSLVWSRDKCSIACNSPDTHGAVDGIDHVFIGHTPLPEVVTTENVTYLDTGAYMLQWRIDRQILDLYPNYPHRLTILRIRDIIK